MKYFVAFKQLRKPGKPNTLVNTAGDPIMFGSEVKARAFVRENFHNSFDVVVTLH